MSCLNPNLMYDKGVYYTPSERYKFLGSLKGYCEREGRSADELLRNPEYMLIPCKHCLACQRAKAMDWATRAAQEILAHPKGTSWFITLTYNEESLPRWYKDDSEEGGHMERGPDEGVPCLWHKDMQDYHKRLRRNQDYAAKKRGEEPEHIRFLMCGEYGTKKGRPHYHEVISGLVLPDVKFVRAKSNTQMLYESEALQKAWPWGRVEIQDATQEAAAYSMGTAEAERIHDAGGARGNARRRAAEPAVQLREAAAAASGSGHCRSQRKGAGKALGLGRPVSPSAEGQQVGPSALGEAAHAQRRPRKGGIRRKQRQGRPGSPVKAF